MDTKFTVTRYDKDSPRKVCPPPSDMHRLNIGDLILYESMHLSEEPGRSVAHVSERFVFKVATVCFRIVHMGDFTGKVDPSNLTPYQSVNLVFVDYQVNPEE